MLRQATPDNTDRASPKPGPKSNPKPERPRSENSTGIEQTTSPDPRISIPGARIDGVVRTPSQETDKSSAGSREGTPTVADYVRNLLENGMFRSPDNATSQTPTENTRGGANSNNNNNGNPDKNGLTLNVGALSDNGTPRKGTPSGVPSRLGTDTTPSHTGSSSSSSGPSTPSPVILSTPTSLTKVRDAMFPSPRGSVPAKTSPFTPSRSPSAPAPLSRVRETTFPSLPKAQDHNNNNNNSNNNHSAPSSTGQQRTPSSPSTRDIPKVRESAFSWPPTKENKPAHTDHAPMTLTIPPTSEQLAAQHAAQKQDTSPGQCDTKSPASIPHENTRSSGPDHPLGAESRSPNSPYENVRPDSQILRSPQEDRQVPPDMHSNNNKPQQDHNSKHHDPSNQYPRHDYQHDADPEREQKDAPYRSSNPDGTGPNDIPRSYYNKGTDSRDTPAEPPAQGVNSNRSMHGDPDRRSAVQDPWFDPACGYVNTPERQRERPNNDNNAHAHLPAEHTRLPSESVPDAPRTPKTDTAPPTRYEDHPLRSDPDTGTPVPDKQQRNRDPWNAPHSYVNTPERLHDSLSGAHEDLYKAQPRNDDRPTPGRQPDVHVHVHDNIPTKHEDRAIQTDDEPHDHPHAPRSSFQPYTREHSPPKAHTSPLMQSPNGSRTTPRREDDVPNMVYSNRDSYNRDPNRPDDRFDQRNAPEYAKPTSPYRNEDNMPRARSVTQLPDAGRNGHGYPAPRPEDDYRQPRDAYAHRSPHEAPRPADIYRSNGGPREGYDHVPESESWPRNSSDHHHAKRNYPVNDDNKNRDMINQPPRDRVGGVPNRVATPSSERPYSKQPTWQDNDPRDTRRPPLPPAAAASPPAEQWDAPPRGGPENRPDPYKAHAYAPRSSPHQSRDAPERATPDKWQWQPPPAYGYGNAPQEVTSPRSHHGPYSNSPRDPRKESAPVFQESRRLSPGGMPSPSINNNDYDNGHASPGWAREPAFGGDVDDNEPDEDHVFLGRGGRSVKFIA
jgi:hypothetical protein